MPLQREQTASIGHLPHPHGIIITPRHHHFPLRAVSHALHSIRIPLQSEQTIPILQPPQPPFFPPRSIPPPFQIKCPPPQCDQTSPPPPLPPPPGIIIPP